MVITIDGPGGTGKSTTAELLANKLGYYHLNSGTLYRWITYNALQQHLDLNDSDVLLKLAQELDYNSIDYNVLREQNVSDNVAKVASIPSIREEIVQIQRNYAKDKNIVVEGRDIGTVVFPEADYKFYFTASLEVRAKRRYNQMQKDGLEAYYEHVLESIAQRDRQDIEREHSPLRKAEDAIEINTDNLTIEEGIDIILAEIKNLSLS
jgi:cytidylate kinase